MLSVRQELIEVLKEQTGLEVYFNMPPVNVNVSMPLLILEEVDNTDHYYNYYEDTDREYEIANVSYEISIYSVDLINVFVFQDAVDKVMKRLGFKKVWTSGDSHVEPLYCKSMRYSAKIELKENNYHIYK